MNKRMAPLAAGFLGVVAGFGAILVGPPRPASAHPLGNFSVNQLDSLVLHPDRIEVAAVVDIAELPTLQERSTVDTDGNGVVSEPERDAYAGASCGELARGFEVSVAEHRLVWTLSSRSFEYSSGAAGLSTSRLECSLTAPAALRNATTVQISNRFRGERVGWRELTAAGEGVHLVDSPLPAHSVSAGLRAYPQDLLSSPLDVRSSRFSVRPGDGPAPAAAGDRSVPSTRAGTFLTSWTFGAERTLRGIVGGPHLTPPVGLLAVVLALALGAGHAALPGHGKTVMAAYLAGRHGRPRDAVMVGATVTLTHTGGVLLLGLLLTTAAGLVGETVLGWLGVVSGGLVAIIGLSMLVGARRRRDRRAGEDHHHDHDGHHDHGAHHDHGSHRHHGDPIHDHGHHQPHRDRPGRLALVSMGVAGGLVPSPSALIILLGAIGLGRTGFGVLLIVGYGVGMAAMLTAAGLLLIRLRDRWARRARTGPRLSRLAGRLGGAAPGLTALLVLLVGLGLAGRALVSLG